jgi:hypothetical protein
MMRKGKQSEGELKHFESRHQRNQISALYRVVVVDHYLLETFIAMHAYSQHTIGRESRRVMLDGS